MSELPFDTKTYIAGGIQSCGNEIARIGSLNWKDLEEKVYLNPAIYSKMR